MPLQLKNSRFENIVAWSGKIIFIHWYPAPEKIQNELATNRI